MPKEINKLQKINILPIYYSPYRVTIKYQFWTLSSHLNFLKIMKFQTMGLAGQMEKSRNVYPYVSSSKYSNVSFQKFNSFYLKVNMSYYKLFPFIFVFPEVLWDLQQKACECCKFLLSLVICLIRWHCFGFLPPSVKKIRLLTSV